MDDGNVPFRRVPDAQKERDKTPRRDLEEARRQQQDPAALSGVRSRTG